MRTNTTALRLSAGALALFLALSPVAGYAKEKENKGKKAEVKVELEAKKADKDSKGNSGNGKKVVTTANVTASTSTSTNSANKSCIKAYGHLIAPGWIKKNGNATVGIDCWLPFGIAKKFQGPNNGGNGTSTPTTTPDTTGPVISSINSSPKQTTATITWLTNEKSDSIVFYATSSSFDVNSSTTARVSKSSLEKDHNVKIENLATSTTYYFKIASKDAAGNVTYSNTFSFNTLAPEVVVTYPVISQIVTLTGTSTVNIAWKTNENATSKVYYGTTTPNTNSSTTPFVLDSNLVTNHSVLVSGLSTSTAYTFVIESKNAQGNDTLSNSFTITTNN